ncbi:DegT/DnrJ/EryC1/StrS family aminotransferase [Helicobacter bizzozeronii]|nr:DegT/DnrJ/EryC1/StrS family aminotransferase [Helicobacter bizzozeronii]
MPYQYPFLDLSALHAPYKDRFKQILARHLEDSGFINAPTNTHFINAFSHYCQSDHGVGVNSGLDALTLMLRAYQILGALPRGAGVIVPSFTFIATILAILHNDLIPQFVDVGVDYLLDPKLVESAITPQSRAILVVHLYGQSANMHALQAIAKKHQLLLLEDAAQAHGALFEGQKVGSLGYASAFSFYPSKNLGALGDGGCVLSSDPKVIEMVQILGNDGAPHRDHVLYAGFNSRLDSLQASFLHAKLPDLDCNNAKRRAVAQLYFEGITNPHIILPPIRNFDEHVFHLFVIRTHARDQLQAHLAKHSIETSIHYPIPCHLQPLLSAYNHIDLPNTQRFSQEILSLPLSPTQSLEATHFIIEAINGADLK